MATSGGQADARVAGDAAADAHDTSVDMAVSTILSAATSGAAPRARGPARPARLTTLRQRRARRLGSHTFSLVDIIVVWSVTAAVITGVVPGPLPDAPVAAVLPFVGGAAVLTALLRRSHAYRFARRERLPRHLAPVLVLAAGVGAASWVAAALLGAGAPSERELVGWTVISAAALVVLHTTWWTLVRRWRSQGWLTPNVVLVGATARAERLIVDTLERRDVHILGVFDDRLARSPSAVRGVPVLGDTDALLRHRITPHLDLIVVTVDPGAMSRVAEIVSRLSTLPNPVTLMVGEDDERARVEAIAQLTDSPLAPLRGTTDPERRAFAKRVQDLVLGVPMLVLLAPILAVVALAVRLDSPGPVLFRQRRHGFNNEEIVVSKFRTLRHETADARAERQVTADDDRVTRVGRFLRRSGIDELPQLANVVRGEMSLVGPRPHAIGMKTGDVESAYLVAQYAHRHRIKPGLTGWAAVNGSRGPLHEPEAVRRRVALDVEYIDRQSFWLDVMILVRTLPSLLGDRSAIR